MIERRGGGWTDGAGGAPADAPAALVLYTSGSTGRPRARCSRTRRWRSPTARGRGPVIGLRDDDVVLAALPLSHAFGINGALLAPLLSGTTVALVERFVPDAVADAARSGSA